MHTVNPRTIKGQVWWDAQRHKAYAENNHCCWACGIPQGQANYRQLLEGHEEYRFSYQDCQMEFIGVVALCHSCHNYIHDGRMRHMVDAGKMQESKAIEIIEHGNRVLDSADPDKLQEHAERMVQGPSVYVEPDENEWGKWHLLLDGVAHYSPFENYEAWEEYHERLNNA